LDELTEATPTLIDAVKLTEDAGSVWWLAWSPDGQRLAVSRATGDISIWNLKEIEAQLEPFGLKP
jgi:WD40 repeat protein